MVTLGSRSKSELHFERKGSWRILRSAKSRLPHTFRQKVLSPSFVIRQIPAQLKVYTKLPIGVGLRQYLKFTDPPNSYSIARLFGEAFRLRKNIWRLSRQQLLNTPGEGRYAFFGLHTQPESSIDVFAHFFSDQVRVIELMSRSIPLPPTIVSSIKAMRPNYSAAALAALWSIPPRRRFEYLPHHQSG